MEVINLTKELLKIPSESGNESEIGKYILTLLGEDFKITTQEIGNRFNILATRGTPKLLLTTHIDTVQKQLEIKEDSKFVYGRGACDTKGIIASMICAAKKAVKETTNFALLFDVSEETDFSGIKEAISLVNPEITVIGEPTNFKAIIGQKGLLGLKLKCVGKSAHGSTPELGISAIENLIELLTKIKVLKFPENEIGKTTLNIGKISGGIAANVVPDYAEAIIEFRTVGNSGEIIKKIPKENLEILYSFEPSLTKDTAFIERFNLEKTTVAYFTEMYFWAKKSKAIVLGPGDPDLAHSDNERISKADLIKGEKLYLKIIKDLTK